MTYGQRLQLLVDARFAADAAEDGMRTHLGASVIGHPCMRAVWFGFRWADREEFDGRMLRLFARGQDEEEVFVRLLKRLDNAGIKTDVWTHDGNGEQYRVSAHGGHFGGSCDGVAMNLPDTNGEGVLLEMKTHNAKSFEKLVKEGVYGSKPKHVKQAQVYMHLMGLKKCLYCAVNKNDDALHFELFDYDPAVGRQMLDRAETIIFGQGMPPRISDSPAWFECRYCAFNGVCFKTKEARVNCRTCIHSKPERSGGWSCALGQAEIGTQPKVGCEKYQVMVEMA